MRVHALALICAGLAPAAAQMTDAERTTMLNRHNELRTRHCAPAMTWDPAIEVRNALEHAHQPRPLVCALARQLHLLVQRFFVRLVSSFQRFTFAVLISGICSQA